MTKDTKDKGVGSSSFRDQILRDLEELKVQRLVEQPQEETLEETETQISEPVEIQPIRNNRETVRIAGMDFPQSYLTEENQAVDETDSSAKESASFVVQEENSPVFEETQSALPQDTVERNLEELRNLVAAAANQVPESLTSTPTEEVIQNDPLATELPVDEAEDELEETFIDFPIEDVSGVSGDTSEAEALSLEETIIAPKPVNSVSDRTKGDSVTVNKTRRRSTSKQKRKKQDKAAKRIVTVVMTVVVLAILVTGFVGYSWVKSNLEPVDAKATETLVIEIPEGSSTLEIGKILSDHKLIKNATVFNYYSKIKSYNNFQSGFYHLKQSMSVDEIAKALQEIGTATAQEPAAGKILIVEGYTLTQIADAVTKNTVNSSDGTTPYTSEQFMATVQNPEFINRMIAAYPQLFATVPTVESGATYQLEGYLFPAVYDYADDTSIESLVEKMISTTDARLQPYYEQIAAKNLTVNEVLTLASLVEKEGSTDEDRRNIASVFYNRLNAGMPLQSNIAILYAQGKLGQATTLAEDTTIDTSIDSPYNIYWKTGLMPGPVDSPSLSAIEAVINPNQTEYLYFVADVTTGTVYYSTTIEEHDENVAKYVNSHLNN